MELWIIRSRGGGGDGEGDREIEIRRVNGYDKVKRRDRHREREAGRESERLVGEVGT